MIKFIIIKLNLCEIIPKQEHDLEGSSKLFVIKLKFN